MEGHCEELMPLTVFNIWFHSNFRFSHLFTDHVPRRELPPPGTWGKEEPSKEQSEPERVESLVRGDQAKRSGAPGHKTPCCPTVKPGHGSAGPSGQRGP